MGALRCRKGRPKSPPAGGYVAQLLSAGLVLLRLLAVGGGKQALAQAIMLKRQKIQADAISALDERTNEMLLKNARNTVEQAKITTRLASGSSIKADTLETTWRTIMTGLDETKKIQESARAQRAQDQAKLEAIKKDFMSRYNMPNR